MIDKYDFLCMVDEILEESDTVENLHSRVDYMINGINHKKSFYELILNSKLDIKEEKPEEDEDVCWCEDCRASFKELVKKCPICGSKHIDEYPF